MVGRSGWEAHALHVARVSSDADPERRPRRGPTPGWKRRVPQLGGEDAIDAALGPRHELLRHGRHGSSAIENSRDRLGRLANPAQGPTQALELLTLFGGELDQQDLRIGSPVPGGTPRRPKRRASARKAFQGGIRVGAGEPGGMSDGITGGGAQPEEGGVDAGLCRRESERSQVNGWSSNSYYYYIS